jgi:CNT family concentrative nucleoside transporter
MQLIIRAFAKAMLWTMKVSGAESLNVAASIFMGQTEAPLTIRPFLPGATRSELMTIMTSGMASRAASWRRTSSMEFRRAVCWRR